MDGIIYLVGLIVIIMFILSFLLIGGRHRDENVAPSMRFSWGR